MNQKKRRILLGTKSGKPKQMIEVGMFCTMESSDFAKYGVKKGDLIYLAGDGLVPESEEDPYLYRKLFVAAFTEDKHLLPDKKPFLVNAVRIKPVSKYRQKKLVALMMADAEAKQQVGIAEAFGEGPDIAQGENSEMPH